MSPRDRAAFERLLARPDGILLVTGPTGSGKTTTLYAALGQLNDRSRNIMTVEDPIEYSVDGVGQTQVNPRTDLTFARGLRAILRQDPDVIMVGEIRDRETAQIAVEAAMTGHFVLSTLHTNTAVGAVARLIDMGVERFLLAPMLAGRGGAAAGAAALPGLRAARTSRPRPTATCSTARSRSARRSSRARRLPRLPRPRLPRADRHLRGGDRRPGDGGADPRRRGRGRPRRAGAPARAEPGRGRRAQDRAKASPRSRKSPAWRRSTRRGRLHLSRGRPRPARPQSGVLEAASAVAARQDLRARGLLPVEVRREPRRSAGRPARPSLLARLRPAVGARDLTLITRQLATLIGSGVRIEDALRTVAQQSRAAGRGGAAQRARRGARRPQPRPGAGATIPASSPTSTAPRSPRASSRASSTR